jgi:hypothetical protein
MGHEIEYRQGVHRVAGLKNRILPEKKVLRGEKNLEA